MTAESTSQTRLAGVVVHSADLDLDVAVYTAITGTTPTRTSPTDRAVFDLDDAHLILATSDDNDDSKRRGIERLVVEATDLDAAENALRSAGADAERSGDMVRIGREWAGVHVELHASTAERERPAQAAGAVLDHVAILVSDVEMMARRWAAILGCAPAHVGVHPLGTSIAGRFLLGDRMIELLAPMPDIASPLRKRLDRFGEGPFALAIISNDLDATMAAVSGSGARLIDQPPHVIVHPSDASGVPVQLTPRVHHEIQPATPTGMGT